MNLKEHQKLRTHNNNNKVKTKKVRGHPWPSTLSMQGAWVWSLVRELEFLHAVQCGQKKVRTVSKSVVTRIHNRNSFSICYTKKHKFLNYFKCSSRNLLIWKRYIIPIFMESLSLRVIHIFQSYFHAFVSINMHYRQIFSKNIKYKYKYKFYSINSRLYKTFKNICLINIRNYSL